MAHTKSKEEIKRVVDRSFDDLFKGIGTSPQIMPLQIVDEKRQWAGDTLSFSFGAKVAMLTSPVRGTIQVTERDVTIDADFGLLEKLLPAAQTKATIENRVKGMLT